MNLQKYVFLSYKMSINNQWQLPGTSVIKQIMNQYKTRDEFNKKFFTGNKNGLYHRALTERKFQWLLGVQRPERAS